MAIDRRPIGTLVKVLRKAGTDTQDIEVKESSRKLPASMPETLSAFSNGSGGVVILGLSEARGFVPVEGFRAKAMADALSTCCSDRLTPPVRPEIDIVDFEGAQLVVARVHELLPLDKPCYVTDRGAYHGSYIRVADGDRKLSTYEVDRLLEDRTQPQFDIEPVEQASLNELDSTLVEAVLRRQRDLHPRIFGSEPDTDVLLSLRALTRGEDGELKPTLAGLLALGRYPQKYYPRLTVAFSAYSENADAPEAFVEAETMAGSIPAIVEDTMAVLQRATSPDGICSQASTLDEDQPAYPWTAVREALSNALMHRDLSPLSRGTAVQVALYPDQLVIVSPGGLYGTTTVETLGKVGLSSARNQFLVSLLESVPFQGGFLVENRGTGYRFMLDELKHAGMDAPTAQDSISMFTVTISRRPARVPPAIDDEVHDDHAAPEVNDEVYTRLVEQGRMTAAELAEACGLARSMVSYRLRKLEERDLVRRVGAAHSPKQAWEAV